MVAIICGLTQTQSVDLGGNLTGWNIDLIQDVKKQNLEHHIKLIEAAHKQGVDILCLGELFQTPYFPLEKSSLWLEAIDTIEDNKSLDVLADVAKQLNIVLIAPVAEKDPLTNQFYNTAVVLGQDGLLLGKYRKCHIPNGGNEIGEFFEKDYFSPSEMPLSNVNGYNISNHALFPVFKTAKTNFGVIICYDRHFPETFQILKENGAKLIFCPSVTFGAVSQRLWSMEFQIEAVRNNVYIGASNRKGQEAPWNVEFFGESFFTGPHGPVQNTSHHPELIIAELDLAALSNDPSGWHLHQNRRNFFNK